MSELMTEIQALRHEVRQLTMLVMKDKIDTTWVNEKDAADMLDIKPQTLRKMVKRGEYPATEINYRNTHGRNWQYSRKGLIKYKNLTSTAA